MSTKRSLSQTQLRQRRARVRKFLPVLLCSAMLLALFYRPVAIFSGSDNAATLITARAILQEGTIKLDKYQHEFAQRGVAFDERFLNLVRKNGHLYNLFPLGSAVLSLPLVVVYNFLGIDSLALIGALKPMLFAVALTCVWVFLMLYLLALRYLRPAVALMTALAFMLGSAFASTLGSSLWTHNFVAPLALTILYLLVKASQDTANPRPHPPSPYLGILIGVLLFLAYLCRPTAILLAPPVFIVLYLLDKPSAYKAIAASVLSGLLFIGFSWYEYGQWLPDYYLGGRFVSAGFWVALYGILLSPSRGLLIYTPVLLLLAFPAGGWRGLLAGREILLPLLLWPVLHLFLIASFLTWHGGHSYGSRLMMDILPVVYLFLLLYLKQLLATPRGAGKFVRVALLVVVAAVSIPMHTYQGLYNPATMKWNDVGGAIKSTVPIFDWRYPQFLHTDARHADMMEAYLAPSLELK